MGVLLPNPGSSALSQAVRQLESRLGVTFVDVARERAAEERRRGRRVVLAGAR